MRIPLCGLGGLLLAATFTSACSDPEATKRAHVASGDKYVAEKRDEFAIVEYARAVKIDPKYGEAHYKLAQAYERVGNLRASFPEYIRAADALPDDRAIQLKASEILLFTGRFEDAKTRVAKLLEKNPKDIEAMLLHANAMAVLRDPSGAVAQIEEALKVSPDSSDAFVSLGAVRMQGGDAKAAEEAFRRAIGLDPSSVQAKLALANFLWAAGRMPEAETTINEVLAKEPQHLLANRMLGVLYLSTRRMKEAEKPLKAVADNTAAPSARLQLADYYAGAGRGKDAVEILTPLSANPATYAEAEPRLAAIDYAEGRTAEAHKRLDTLLAKVPSHLQALVMKTQWLTREDKLDEALEKGKAAVSADPQSASAQFALATVYDRRKETAEAVKAYNETLRLNPRAVAAQVELSRLSLSAGDKAGALQYAEDARRSQPSSLDARAVLARSLIAGGNLPRAEAEVNELMKYASNVAVVQAVRGTLLASKRDFQGARLAFERALEITPGFLEAIGGLTYLDLAAKTPDKAVARLEAEIARQPGSGPLYALLARAHRAGGDETKAEQVLRRGVTADPRFTTNYAMLAEHYVRQGRLDEARAEFEGIAKRNPADVSARTMVGWLYESQGKKEEAIKAYDAAVNAPGGAPIAANNLAYIYAEQERNLDMALQLATQAKQRLPEDASVDDTIGWIYYKKNQPQQALRHLQDSVRRRPDNAETLFHLGLTYAKLGDKPKAKEALERALKLDPKVGGEEAQRTLAQVSK